MIDHLSAAKFAAALAMAAGTWTASHAQPSITTRGPSFHFQREFRIAAACIVWQVWRVKGIESGVVGEFIGKEQCEFEAASKNKLKDGWSYHCANLGKTTDCPGLDPPKK